VVSNIVGGVVHVVVFGDGGGGGGVIHIVIVVLASDCVGIVIHIVTIFIF
jgi:hypothetical protein